MFFIYFDLDTILYVFLHFGFYLVNECIFGLWRHPAQKSEFLFITFLLPSSSLICFHFKICNFSSVHNRRLSVLNLLDTDNFDFGFHVDWKIFHSSLFWPILGLSRGCIKYKRFLATQNFYVPRDSTIYLSDFWAEIRERYDYPTNKNT